MTNFYCIYRTSQQKNYRRWSINYTILKISIMESLNIEVLNGSHISKSLFYNSLIIVPNKYSTTLIETS